MLAGTCLEKAFFLFRGPPVLNSPHLYVLVNASAQTEQGKSFVLAAREEQPIVLL